MSESVECFFQIHNPLTHVNGIVPFPGWSTPACFVSRHRFAPGTLNRATHPKATTGWWNSLKVNFMGLA